MNHTLKLLYRKALEDPGRNYDEPYVSGEAVAALRALPNNKKEYLKGLIYEASRELTSRAGKGPIESTIALALSIILGMASTVWIIETCSCSLAERTIAVILLVFCSFLPLLYPIRRSMLLLLFALAPTILTASYALGVPLFFLIPLPLLSHLGVKWALSQSEIIPLVVLNIDDYHPERPVFTVSICYPSREIQSLQVDTSIPGFWTGID